MPVLSDPKHEAFARFVAQGKSKRDAAISAGFSERSASNMGYKLANRDEIRRRIEELSAKVEEKVAEVAVKGLLTRDWVIEQLIDNIQKAKQDVEVLDRQGNPTGTYVYQGMVANKALELLGKELGMFANQVELSGRNGETLKFTVERIGAATTNA